MFGVKFGDKHSYDDFGLILTDKVISEPKAQTKFVSVPGRNGSIDLTEVLTGDVRYEDRTIVITFAVKDNAKNIESRRAELANYLHGKQFRIVFDDDLSYYWLGRVDVGDFDTELNATRFACTCTVQPYKYNITIDDSEWLWDPFNFEYGIISNIAIDVTGEYDFPVSYMGRVQNPIITVDVDDMQYQYDGGEITPLPQGTNIIYGIMLTEGEHNIKFIGNGTVKVDYVGGSL